MGPYAGPVIPDVVAVGVRLVGDNGAVVEVKVVGGCCSLALGVVSSLAAVGGLWGPSNVAWGSIVLLVACVSPHVSLSSSNSGCWDLHTWVPVSASSRSGGSCSLSLGMHSSASSVTFHPFSLALTIMAGLGGERSVIVGVATLAGMGAAGT